MLNDSKSPHARNADEDFVPSSDIAVQGRGSIWTSVGEWVVLAPISDRATRLYWLLRAHVNHTRTLADGSRDQRVWPTQERLAEMLGVSKRQTVAAALAELVDVGAVDVTPERYAGGLRQRNVYTVHLDPPEWFGGHRSVVELHRARKVDEAENPQVTPTYAQADVRGSAPADGNQTNDNQTNKKSSPPARHRSADRRRAKIKADEKRANREARRAWELPPDDDRAWLSFENEDLAEDIIWWVEEHYGDGERVRNMVEDMVWRPGYTPIRILNAALKQELDALGITDDEPLPDWLVDTSEPAQEPPRLVVVADPWAAAEDPWAS